MLFSFININVTIIKFQPGFLNKLMIIRLMPEELEKTLSYPVILIITINSIMGTGIFFLPAVGAREAGPASLISWGVLALIAIYISMIFAELTSMFPKAGGVYEFCKQAYGRFPSFLIGWMTILAGNVTIAMLIVGAIQYILPFSGLMTIAGIIIQAKYIKLAICMFFILVFNFIAYKGVKTSATMLVAFGLITIGTLISLIIPGLIHLNIPSILVSSTGVSELMPYGVISILICIFFIAETFFGWETATFLAAETKDGERVMPKALIVSTVVIAIFSLTFIIISLGNMPWDIFGASNSPLIELGILFYGPMGESIFMMLVYLSIIGSVAGWIVSAPRLLLAMAEDKLLLGQFKEIHPINKTPHKAIAFQTVLTLIIVIVGFESYEFLLHLLVPLVLVMYSFVIGSVLILRKKLPDHPRYYKAPYVKFGASFVIVFLLFLVGMWVAYTHGAWNTLKFALSLIGLGIPLYFLIEMYYDPEAIIKINDQFAYLALLTEKISLPVIVRKRIFSLLGDINNKTVLEYGCNVGTMTLLLAKQVGPLGKVYATDISIKHLKITQSRVEKHRKKDLNHGKVEMLHDEHQMIRIHPSIPYADVVVSVGMLGYVQNVKQVLSDIYNILPEGGEICFVDFGDFFKIIPNVEWLSHNHIIEKVFRDAGFSVRVIREKGLFWNYIYVYGIKSDHDIPFI